MDEKAISRIKCAMIVYELERAIGRFVRSHSSEVSISSTGKEILSRISVPKSDPEQATQAIIENSYLGEILAIAIVIAKGTSNAEHFSNLERLFSALDLYDIRNAISHPNREFPECYWYRCAAIASDPITESLGFFEVSLAFQNALDGKIDEPPENWMHKRRWSTPTILPTDFEHAITGLVGRIRDVNRLEKEIKNKRSPLIALVARGGVGKTSLMLQAMTDFCLSAEASQYTDGVLWASFKQERLTSAGIELLTAPKSLEELEASLTQAACEIFGEDYENFSAMKTKLSEKRIILCLDNLETLLRDSPDAFNQFYEDLPGDWKVLVTSRIAVDSAKNLPLDVLDHNGAVALAKAYLYSKGGQIASSEIFDRIATGCNQNPLAIRLTIELYLSGAEISDALQRSEKDVLTFSFTSLLDQLSPLENETLEAIFVLENPDRVELCEALSATADDIAEAIAKLSKTSLITRVESDHKEIYALGNSIRDLLRAYPRELAIRSRIVDWLAKTKASRDLARKTQREWNLSPVDLSYFPATVASQLISVCKQLQAAIKREDRSAIISIESGLRQQISSDSTSSFLYRLYAWTVFELDDLAIAITYFQKAIALDKEDPAPLFGLVLTYQKQSNKTDLAATLGILVEKGWGDVDRSGKRYANRIWGLYLRAANESEDYQLVFNATQTWNDKLTELPSLAINRASAHRRKAFSDFKKRDSETEQVFENYKEAALLLLKVLISEGFLKWVLPEVRRFIADARYFRTRGVDFFQADLEQRSTISNLLKYCLSNEAYRAGIPDGDARDLIDTIENGADNLRLDIHSNYRNRETFESNGYIFAKIKNGMRPTANYFFAQDDSMKDYYIGLDVFENGNPSRKHLLRPGIELAVKFEPAKGQNAYRAVEAWLVG